MNIDYQLLKALHIIGAIIFMGNIIVTAFWKVFADRTKDVKIIAFAQRLVTITDFVFTTIGAGLVLITGLLMATLFYENFITIKWIALGMGLFVLSGLIWLSVLIPIQIKQAQLTRQFENNDHIPDNYWRLEKIWYTLGTIATILPLINIYFMVFKPI